MTDDAVDDAVATLDIGEAGHGTRASAHLAEGGERNALAQLRAVFGEANHLRIFAFSALLVFSGFLVFPFIAPYLVTNVGVSEAQLPLVYLVAGIAALLTARLVGGWSDSVGRKVTLSRVVRSSVCCLTSEKTYCRPNVAIAEASVCARTYWTLLSDAL